MIAREWANRLVEGLMLRDGKIKLDISDNFCEVGEEMRVGSTNEKKSVLLN